jgi:hypothetical protein
VTAIRYWRGHRIDLGRLADRVVWGFVGLCSGFALGVVFEYTRLLPYLCSGLGFP